MEQLKKAKKINLYLRGEHFSCGNSDQKMLCQKYPELILNAQVQNLNSGITIVEIIS